MRIKVMADYGCHPLWWDGMDIMGEIAPTALGLSHVLCIALAQWAARYDAILNTNDPAASRFADDAEEERFEADGRALALQVAEELGASALVRYWRDAR